MVMIVNGNIIMDTAGYLYEVIDANPIGFGYNGSIIKELETGTVFHRINITLNYTIVGPQDIVRWKLKIRNKNGNQLQEER
jgi:hypothetical protein